MSNNLNRKVLIVGAGAMSVEYIKVLNELNISYTIVGRGEESALNFKEKTGVFVHIGGLEKFVQENNLKNYTHAIVVTGVDTLYNNTKLVLDAGIKNILVEKPGGINSVEIEDLANKSKKENANILIAYNRRFYQSVLNALDIIKNDGGVTSFHFEFTEWAHVIEPLKTAANIKNKWFLANSSHVVDLAFYLGGLPKQMSSYKAGELAWHPYAKYAGAGLTENDSVFSYHANWAAPGRWSVEILTNKHRLYFKPMESLQIQELGSVAVNPVQIDDTIDKKFKPGLYIQTKLFVEGNFSNFCSIKEQYENMKWYDQISGYDAK